MIAYPLDVSDLTTRVLESGVGGPCVALIHGLGSRADRWRANVDALAAGGYRVLAVDLPGHGFASKGAAFDYTVPGYARFVEALLERTGAREPAILIGASFGGYVAAALACSAPARVAALVMIGSLGLSALDEQRRARSIRALRGLTRELLRERLLGAVADPALVTDELVEEEFRINASMGAPEAFHKLANYFAGEINHDLVIERLARVRHRFPLLLAWGELDRSVPLTVAKDALAKLPGATLAIFRGLGHMPYLEGPQLFNRVILDFLAGGLGAYEGVDIVRT